MENHEMDKGTLFTRRLNIFQASVLFGFSSNVFSSSFVDEGDLYFLLPFSDSACVSRGVPTINLTCIQVHETTEQFLCDLSHR